MPAKRKAKKNFVCWLMVSTRTACLRVSASLEGCAALGRSWRQMARTVSHTSSPAITKKSTTKPSGL